jgi:hypothetical protein
MTRTNARDLREIAANLQIALRSKPTDVIAVGNLLIEARDQLDHGDFLPWVKEFDVKVSSAYNYIYAARFVAKFPIVIARNLKLRPCALYELGYEIQRSYRMLDDQSIEAILREAERKWVTGNRVRQIALQRKHAGLGCADFCHEASLYRHYGDNDDLLYVGISGDAVDRQKDHLKSAEWRADIRKITIEPCETYKQAEQAERRAIRSENPRYNKVRYHVNNNKRSRAGNQAMAEYMGISERMLRKWQEEDPCVPKPAHDWLTRADIEAVDAWIEGRREEDAS